jgi:hypothetical protein
MLKVTEKHIICKDKNGHENFSDKITIHNHPSSQFRDLPKRALNTDTYQTMRTNDVS